MIQYKMKEGGHVPISDAKKAANRKWDEANRGRYWRATVVFPAEDKDKVLRQAEQRNESFSDYVRGLIKRDMENH